MCRVKMILRILLIHLTFQTLLLVKSESEFDQNELNPIYDELNINHEKDHDKRTIFNSLHAGWAKHVGVHPSGVKYVIGFSPVDLKYVPVVKSPIKIVHHRPLRIFKLNRPSKPSKPIHHDHVSGWKPILKPIAHPVQVVKPIIQHPPPPEHPSKPWQENDWKPKPVVPVHVVPAVINHPPVQVYPIPIHHHHEIPLQQPIVPIHHHHHQVPVQEPIGHFHHHHIPIPEPVVPIHHNRPVPVHPLVPHSHLFEVTRPNLPVLPLGSTFPSPVFHANHLHSNLLIQRPLEINYGHHHHLHSIPTVHQQVHPGLQVQEVHPHHNHHGIPTVHQHAGLQVQEVYPHHHLHGVQPVQFHAHQHSGGLVREVVNPHHHHGHQDNSAYLGNLQQQTTEEQYLPSHAHGQLPLEGDGARFENQNQYPPINQNYNEVSNNNLIQPGQTDVQTPLYLPQHTTFNSQISSDQLQNFKPSPELHNFGYNRREFVEKEEQSNSEEKQTDETDESEEVEED